VKFRRIPRGRLVWRENRNVGLNDILCCFDHAPTALMHTADAKAGEAAKGKFAPAASAPLSFSQDQRADALFFGLRRCTAGAARRGVRRSLRTMR
jgi:hypothetical protein